MPKKYIIRTFNPGKLNHKRINPLINLSSLGINTLANVIKSSLSLGASESLDYGMEDAYYPYGDNLYNNKFNKFRDLTNMTTLSYAFFDKVYSNRRDYLRLFAQSNELSFVLDTISNEAIIMDENGYFAELDLDRLKLSLNKGNNKPNNKTDELIKDCLKAFKISYSLFGWDRNNDAWNYFKKFLIDGYLAFEIIFDDPTNPKEIILYKEVDPVTLEPEIHIYDGKEMMVWYQFRGDALREHIIPDANLIYISWTGMNFSNFSRVSYLEGLTRSFNMLRQMENSRIIWNILNAQKRIKITVPVGGIAEAKAQQRISEVMADYNEETSIDDLSGEVLVNGEPKYSFTKTYVFPARDGNSTDISEMGVEGYDMSSVEGLKYFWRRFIMETQIPANRFMLDVTSAPSNPLAGDSNVTREEYLFGRFINRIRAIYKEVLLKPLWILICLLHPELQFSYFIRQSLGIKFHEENLFVIAKKRAIINDGASTVSTLLGIQDMDGKPYFSIDWVVKEYLGLTDQDLQINRKYKEAEVLRKLEQTKRMKDHQEYLKDHQAEGAEGMDMQNEDGGFGGMDSGFGGGGGFDSGFGGPPDMGGGPEPMDAGPEPADAGPEPPAE